MESGIMKEWKVVLVWRKGDKQPTTFEQVTAATPLEAIAAAQQGWQLEPGWALVGLEVRLMENTQ